MFRLSIFAFERVILNECLGSYNYNIQDNPKHLGGLKKAYYILFIVLVKYAH